MDIVDFEGKTRLKTEDLYNSDSKPTPLRSAYESLVYELEELSGEFGKLKTQLTPVCRPTPSEMDGTPTTAKEGNISPVVEDLNRQTRRIVEMREMVMELRTVLDV